MTKGIDGRNFRCRGVRAVATAIVKKKIRAAVAKEAGQGMPIEKTTATRIKSVVEPAQPAESIRATAAKEVGMRNPAEKTAVRPNQSNIHY